MGIWTSSHYWALNSLKPRLKLGISPITGYYIVATLLTNLLLCVTGGNQISEKHSLSSPRVEDYLYISEAR